MNTTSTPLRGWALEFARRWNAHTHSVFLLHGNIHDVFPTREGYAPLKTFLMKRLLPEGRVTLYYDIGDGLSFGAPEMQTRFFEWLQVFDSVEGTNFSQTGAPRNFTQLAPLLRRFVLAAADERKGPANVSIIIDFAEKIIPATEESGASQDERMALVTLLKWAASPEFRRSDASVVLITESAGELHPDLIQNPHVAQIRLDLPDLEDRAAFLRVEFDAQKSDLTLEQFAERSSGLSLLRLRHLQ